MSSRASGNPVRLIYRGFAAHDHAEVDAGSDSVGLDVEKSFHTGNCPNCQRPFLRFVQDKPDPRFAGDVSYLVLTPNLFRCEYCGWWQLRGDGVVYPGSSSSLREPTPARYAHSYHSILEPLDIGSNDVALTDLRHHLLRRWEDRKVISAGKAQDLVASVLKDHLKCDVLKLTANANAPDGGIDLFICSIGGQVNRAVQVKRRMKKDVEPIDDVRHFVGALVLEGYRKGIFVTTARRFSKPAAKVAANARLKRHRLELDLINGAQYLSCLSPPAAGAPSSYPRSSTGGPLGDLRTAALSPRICYSTSAIRLERCVTLVADS
jgi:restriction system protein